MPSDFVPFADIDDFYEIVGTEDSYPSRRISAKLRSASVKVAAALDNHAIPWQTKRHDPLYSERLREVVCAMAHRALANETQHADIPYGATQFTTSAGGFSEQLGFQGGGSQSFGELYISKAERDLLGLNRQRVVSIPMATPGGDACAWH